MVYNVSSRTRFGLYAYPFLPGIFEMHSHVQIKTSSKSENLQCFSGIGRTKRGLAKLKYIFFRKIGGIRPLKCALTGAFLMS